MSLGDRSFLPCHADTARHPFSRSALQFALRDLPEHETQLFPLDVMLDGCCIYLVVRGRCLRGFEECLREVNEDNNWIEVCYFLLFIESLFYTECFHMSCVPVARIIVVGFPNLQLCQSDDRGDTSWAPMKTKNPPGKGPLPRLVCSSSAYLASVALCISNRLSPPHMVMLF